jgi:hypothetical protein
MKNKGKNIISPLKLPPIFQIAPQATKACSLTPNLLKPLKNANFGEIFS